LFIAITINKERNKTENRTNKRVEISQTKTREGKRKEELAAEEIVQKMKEEDGIRCRGGTVGRIDCVSHLLGIGSEYKHEMSSWQWTYRAMIKDSKSQDS
jgi:hypothetical protein